MKTEMKKARFSERALSYKVLKKRKEMCKTQNQFKRLRDSMK